MANPFYSSPFWKRLRRAALRRDNGRCTVSGCIALATTVDHIATRPRGLTVPCAADRLDNLRSLCATHDCQVKEDASGRRRRGGRPVLKGCDADGWPRSPLRYQPIT